MTADPTPLLVLPLPCDARLTVALLDAVAKSWEADHLGETMTVAHWEQREASEFGKVLIVWDQPVDQAKETP